MNAANKTWWLQTQYDCCDHNMITTIISGPNINDYGYNIETNILCLHQLRYICYKNVMFAINFSEVCSHCLNNLYHSINSADATILFKYCFKYIWQVVKTWQNIWRITCDIKSKSCVKRELILKWCSMYQPHFFVEKLENCNKCQVNEEKFRWSFFIEHSNF